MEEQLSLYAHYDPETDIVLLRLDAVDGAQVVSEETEFGLRDIDSTDGRIVGLEVWDASSRLPNDFIALIGPPGAAAA